MSKNIAILIDKEIEYPKDYDFCSLNELEKLTTEYTNIYIGDLIDYLPTDKIKEILQEILDKIVQNGRLHIKGPDIFQLCLYCSKLNLDLSKFRYIIYENGRKSCYTVDEIIVLISDIPDIQIESVSYINGYEYSVTIKKI
jgi:hypothetical protein